MSFDLYKYASNYRGRVQLDRIGFIRNKHNPKRLDVNSVLSNCAQQFKNPQVLIRKYTVNELTDENEIATSVIGSDFFIKNSAFVQMREAFEYGLDKLAWRSADTVQKELGPNTTVSEKDRFNMLLEASIVNLIFESNSNSASSNQLSECESILERAFKAVEKAAAGEDPASFYPTGTDILRCKLLRALTYLVNLKPLEAANVLLHVPQTCIDVPNDRINDIATISDIVMYVVLSSMARMNRDELRRNVIENTNFCEWLDHRECEDCKLLLNSFFHCKWNTAWSLLGVICERAKYDMFFNRLVDNIQVTIRCKMLLEYCRSYECVSIEAMANAFGVDKVQLEQKLLSLIDNGSLNARIDGINHNVVRFTPDARIDAFESALKAGKAFEDWTERALFYSNIVDAGYLNADVLSEVHEKSLRTKMEMNDYQIAAALSRHQQRPGPRRNEDRGKSSGFMSMFY